MISMKNLTLKEFENKVVKLQGRLCEWELSYIEFRDCASVEGNYREEFREVILQSHILLSSCNPICRMQLLHAAKFQISLCETFANS